MFRLYFPAWIFIVFLLPSQSLKSQTYLNYNQPYVNHPNAKEPFLTKSDNNDFWENINFIREKKVGYKDTEFGKNSIGVVMLLNPQYFRRKKNTPFLTFLSTQHFVCTVKQECTNIFWVLKFWRWERMNQKWG